MDNNDAAYLSFVPLLRLYKKEKTKKQTKKRGERKGA